MTKPSHGWEMTSSTCPTKRATHLPSHFQLLQAMTSIPKTRMLVHHSLTQTFPHIHPLRSTMTIQTFKR